jgi:hypothetical protein
MPTHKRSFPVGSIGTVRGVEHGQAMIILGPFSGVRQTPEYVIAPVYSGSETDFGWTDQDVRLEATETSYAKPVFLGIWNAQQALETDLDMFVMRVPDAMVGIALAQDVYWAASQNRSVAHSRLGPPLLYESRTAGFRLREVMKWGHVSLHALEGSRAYLDNNDDTAERSSGENRGA